MCMRAYVFGQVLRLCQRLARVCECVYWINWFRNEFRNVCVFNDFAPTIKRCSIYRTHTIVYMYIHYICCIDRFPKSHYTTRSIMYTKCLWPNNTPNTINCSQAREHKHTRTRTMLSVVCIVPLQWVLGPLPPGAWR